ncbi:MAG TPA: hypothetical protein VGB81_16685 [Devosia sp.]|jgi:hypothetical protein
MDLEQWQRVREAAERTLEEARQLRLEAEERRAEKEEQTLLSQLQRLEVLTSIAQGRRMRDQSR